MDFINKIRILPTDEAVELIEDTSMDSFYKEPLMKMVNVLFYSDWDKAVEVYKAILKEQRGSADYKEHKFIETRFFYDFVVKDNGVDEIDNEIRSQIYSIAFGKKLSNDYGFWQGYVDKLDIDSEEEAITFVYTHFKMKSGTALPRILLKKHLSDTSIFDRIYERRGDGGINDWKGVTRLVEFIIHEYSLEDLSYKFIGSTLIPFINVGDKVGEKLTDVDGATLVWTEANRFMLEKVLATEDFDAQTACEEATEILPIEGAKETEKLLEPGLCKIFKDKEEWEPLDGTLSTTEFDVLKTIMLSKEQDRKEYLMITAKAMYRQLSQIMGQGSNVQLVLDMFLMTANNWKEKLMVYKDDKPYDMLLDLFIKLDKEAVMRAERGSDKKARTSAGKRNRNNNLEDLIKKIVNENNL